MLVIKLTCRRRNVQHLTFGFTYAQQQQWDNLEATKYTSQQRHSFATGVLSTQQLGYEWKQTQPQH